MVLSLNVPWLLAEYQGLCIEKTCRMEHQDMSASPTRKDVGWPTGTCPTVISIGSLGISATDDYGRKTEAWLT